MNDLLIKHHNGTEVLIRDVLSFSVEGSSVKVLHYSMGIQVKGTINKVMEVRVK